MDAATEAMDWSPEEHCRFTVCTGTFSGKPARNIPIRHSVARWEAAPSTEPKTTSPTSCGEMPVASTAALSTAATMSSTGVSRRPPRLAFVKGVRPANTMTTSSSFGAVWRRRRGQSG